ncbi:hypothetical protein GOBAR_DD21273 [Gossypium barbadense]|nr:hypothetical protein GOBAR_DD21273 [Gossypium barbadense]
MFKNQWFIHEFASSSCGVSGDKSCPRFIRNIAFLDFLRCRNRGLEAVVVKNDGGLIATSLQRYMFQGHYAKAHHNIKRLISMTQDP